MNGPQRTHGDAMRSVITLLAVMAGTFLAVWFLANVALRVTGVPKAFPPFTVLPLLSGVVGGFVGASAVYLLLTSISVNPNRSMFFVSIFVLALSFGLPLRLSFTKSPRFAGVTPSAQMVLALLHSAVATAAICVLTTSK